MATPILPADNSGSTALNDLLGLANGALDIWGNYSQAKIQNTAAKNALPSTVVQAQPSPGGFTLDTKTVLIGVAILGAAVGVPLLIKALKS